MDRLEEFRTMVDKIDDKDLLDGGLLLVRNMIKLNNLKKEIKELESGLTNNQGAIFYFFAEELDEDELVFAAERISGRIKRLSKTEK
jgi:hypothetical protein